MNAPSTKHESTSVPLSLKLWLACADFSAFSAERFSQLLGTHYDATTDPPVHRGDKCLVPIHIPNQMLSRLLADAENGTLDEHVVQTGARFVQEILQRDQCLFNHIPLFTWGPAPRLVDVAPEELKTHLHQVDIVLVTTTEVERKALYEVMKPFPGYEGLVEGSVHHNTYRLGQFGRYIAAHVESTMGSQARSGSMLTVRDAIAELAPKAVVIIGIAFGLKPVKQRLGDVIIAETIIPYELQRIDQKVTHRGQPLPCGPILSERFRTRRTGWKLDRGMDTVEVFQEPLLSGEKLSDNPVFRGSLVEAFPTAHGGEMEGAGAYGATERMSVEVILVKAICDWGDGNKTDRAQPFAAKAAVSLSHYVLSKRDVLHSLGARDRGLPEEVSPAPTPTPTRLKAPDSAQRIVNSKRAALHLFVAESGIREANASIALVGCALMQRPDEVANALERRREDLIHDAFLAPEEKKRLQRQGFVPNMDSAAARHQMLAFLTVADFDVFAFYAKKTQYPGDEDSLRKELLTKLFQNRLSSKKWPVATVRCNELQLHSYIKDVGVDLTARSYSNVSTPKVQLPRSIEPCLVVAEYSCALIHARLEQLLGGSAIPAQALDFERIRDKVRWVMNTVTGESYHRRRPMP